MEASYQKYKGRINFVWVYGSEAHPEEYPFVKGSESKDLGWTHPYTISKTMAERAQRARWLKSDLKPPAQIPMLIDFINQPGKDNNAIRREFLGSGFYSGFVIDCDGTVLIARTWAWFAQGRGWWGLPLTRIESLHGFLDNYLASPPACYGVSAGPPPQPPAADSGSVASWPDAGASQASPPGSSSDPPANEAAGGAAEGCAVGAANGGALPLWLLLLSLPLRRRRAVRR